MTEKLKKHIFCWFGRLQVIFACPHQPPASHFFLNPLPVWSSFQIWIWLLLCFDSWKHGRCQRQDIQAAKYESLRVHHRAGQVGLQTGAFPYYVNGLEEP